MIDIVVSCCFVGVVFGESSDRLPFTCPYKIPKNLLQPGEEDGGFAPNLNLDRVGSTFYAQYRAAQALVPCGANALQIFIEDDPENRASSVAVIYVFDEAVDKLKSWLKYVEQTLTTRSYIYHLIHICNVLYTI